MGMKSTLTSLEVGRTYRLAPEAHIKDEFELTYREELRLLYVRIVSGPDQGGHYQASPTDEAGKQISPVQWNLPEQLDPLMVGVTDVEPVDGIVTTDQCILHGAKEYRVGLARCLASLSIYLDGSDPKLFGDELVKWGRRCIHHIVALGVGDVGAEAAKLDPLEGPALRKHAESRMQWLREFAINGEGSAVCDINLAEWALNAAADAQQDVDALWEEWLTLRQDAARRAFNCACSAIRSFIDAGVYDSKKDYRLRLQGNADLNTLRYVKLDDQAERAQYQGLIDEIDGLKERDRQVADEAAAEDRQRRFGA